MKRFDMEASSAGRPLETSGLANNGRRQCLRAVPSGSFRKV